MWYGEIAFLKDLKTTYILKKNNHVWQSVILFYWGFGKSESHKTKSL